MSLAWLLRNWRNYDQQNRELKSRVKELERRLVSLAESVERTRIAKPVIVSPTKPRVRTKGDLVRVTFGDLHGMKMSKLAVAALLGDIKTLCPDEIVIGGDLADCGGFLAQHHTLGYVAETQYTYEEDIAVANSFLDSIQKAAPSAAIQMLEGNHENRVERWIITETLRNFRDSVYLRKLLGPQFLLKLTKRGIRYFARNEIHGSCRQPGFVKKGKCFFVHEISSAQNAAAEALRKAACNIVYFHTHRADGKIGFRPGVGNIGAWNPGCLCELRPMWQHTRPNDWTHGYGVQLVAPSGNFLHINVPIVDGQSLLVPLTTRA